MTRILATALAFVVAFASLAPAASPLAQVPDDAVGLVVVRSAADVNAAVGRVAAALQVPAPDLLPMVQAMTGVFEGFDQQGTLITAVFFDPKTQTLAPVVYLPVSDYSAFLAQLHPRTPQETISEVTLAGEALVAGRKGNHAVLARLADRPQLTRVLNANTGIEDIVTPLQPWLDAQQAAAIVTPSGLQVLREQAVRSIDEGLKELTNLSQVEGGEVLASQLAPLEDTIEAAKELLNATRGELVSVAIGLKVDDQASIHLSARCPLKEDGRLATWARNVKLPPRGLLGLLPDAKFIAAYGGLAIETDQSFLEAISKMSDASFQAMGLDGEQRQAYLDAMRRVYANQITSAGFMGQLRPGDSLTSTVMTVEQVKDAQEHLRLMRDLFNVLTEAMEKAGIDNTYEIRDTTVGELKAVEVSIDYAALMRRESTQEAFDLLQGFTTQLFGEGGVARAYLAVADRETVVMAYSKDLLELGVAQVRSNATGLERGASIVNTAALLPAKAQWVLYINPQGLLQAIDSLMKDALEPELAITIPAFPASDPLGMGAAVSPNAIEASAVVPKSLVAAIGQYIKTLSEVGGPAERLP